MENYFFLTQIKHKTDGTFEKGVVVKTSLDSARQSFHAYLGAYGYGNDQTVDYVACYIADEGGRITDSCIDDRRPRPEPEEV